MRHVERTSNDRPNQSFLCAELRRRCPDAYWKSSRFSRNAYCKLHVPCLLRPGAGVKGSTTFPNRWTVDLTETAEFVSMRDTNFIEDIKAPPVLGLCGTQV